MCHFSLRINYFKSAQAIRHQYIQCIPVFVLSMSALPMFCLVMLFMAVLPVFCLFLLTGQSQTVGTQQRIATPRLVRTYKFLYMYQGFKIMHASTEL